MQQIGLDPRLLKNIRQSQYNHVRSSSFVDERFDNQNLFGQFESQLRSGSGGNEKEEERRNRSASIKGIESNLISIDNLDPDPAIKPLDELLVKKIEYIFEDASANENSVQILNDVWYTVL